MPTMKTKTTIIRTYSELMSIPTFLGRYEYLKLDGRVGQETFGFDRYLNQRFYHSDEWRSVRDYVIVRDLGCDLAMEGYEIQRKIYIHHMNPITQKDIECSNADILNPEFLICTTHITHNAIHYADASLLATGPIERRPNDTCPWKN